MTVLTSKGDGSFSTAGSSDSGTTITSIALGDFNGDGKADVVAAGGTNIVSVLQGFGNGTLAHGQLFTTGAGPVSVAAVDLDGDGLPDVITAGSGGIPVLSMTASGFCLSPPSAVEAGRRWRGEVAPSKTFASLLCMCRTSSFGRFRASLASE